MMVDLALSIWRIKCRPEQSVQWRCVGGRKPHVESDCRARRGTSGALYLQSAPAGLNSLPRPALADAGGEIDVEDRVPRTGDA